MTNIETFKGDSFTRILKFTDSLGAKINITGYTFYLTVKNSATDIDDDAVISKTVTPELLSDPTNGETAIAISAAEMATIDSGTYSYDIKYKKGDGTVFTALSGSFVVNDSITQRTS